jgi:hypothetical protein
MPDPFDGPDYLGDPQTVLDDDNLSRESKISRLRQWRDALRQDAHDETESLGSGGGHQLVEIERALHELGAGGHG